MWFFGGKGRLSDPKHIRRARAYLDEARMAMLEHSVAAEHYKSMTSMYAQRVHRLEQDIADWEAQRDGKTMAQVEPTAAPEVDTPVRSWGSNGVVMPLSGADTPPEPERGGRRHAA